MKQIGLKRAFFDYAPILLETTQAVNWGPIPFKMINWWVELEDFKQLVRRFWTNTHIEGWGSYVIKEKLKLLKSEIKIWKKDRGGDFKKEIAAAEDWLHQLDLKMESNEWNAANVEDRKFTLYSLEENLLKRDRLAFQKSKVKWIKEGDANSGYFHSVVNRRAKLAEIKCMKINNE
ncbi:hypothetical protein ACS0TY_033777 [Phlomoides rotata]